MYGNYKIFNACRTYSNIFLNTLHVLHKTFCNESEYHEYIIQSWNRSKYTYKNYDVLEVFEVYDHASI